MSSSCLIITQPVACVFSSLSSLRPFQFPGVMVRASPLVPLLLASPSAWTPTPKGGFSEALHTGPTLKSVVQWTTVSGVGWGVLKRQPKRGTWLAGPDWHSAHVQRLLLKLICSQAFSLWFFLECTTCQSKSDCWVLWSDTMSVDNSSCFRRETNIPLFIPGLGCWGIPSWPLQSQCMDLVWFTV